MKFLLFITLFLLMLNTSCANNDDGSLSEIPKNESTEMEAPVPMMATPPEKETPLDPSSKPPIVTESLKNEASIVSVSVSGNEGNYTFNVGISSPDTGCKQYANWWEVISEDGKLIKRRILGHSHVNEQPFVRSDSGIQIKNNQIVIVRGHMNTSGYGTIVFKGSVKTGFSKTTLDKKFASNLSTVTPLPTSCAF